MKNFLGLVVLVFVAAIGWRVAGLLSIDALGMALGIIFGMMAGVPAALMALSIERRSTSRWLSTAEPPDRTLPQPSPSVIIVSGSAPTMPLLTTNRNTTLWPEHMAQTPLISNTLRPQRQFLLIGEEDSHQEIW